MTYRKLLAKLKKLPNKWLDVDVTVLDMDNSEFYPITGFLKVKKTGTLDVNHPILLIK